MSHSRKLSAILFTDIEGYSALMQRDEQKANHIRHKHRQVTEKEHKKYHGKIIQFYGDGTLSVFTSAVEAVECAREMQIAFRKTDVPVRMGLHMGDVLFDEESVFGDGVNIASRIESLGVSGSVLLSDKVQDEIHNHPNLKTISVGTYHLKNIERKIEVFAIDDERLVKPIPNSLKGKTENKNNHSPRRLKKHLEKSIAVLPFENMSNDPEQEYFSDGMAEEIINSLVYIKGLKVTGRTSSFQFKGKNADVKEIGESLGVNTVMEGSIRKSGNRLRVTVQLINAQDGFHIWSEKYDRNMDDVFEIQDEIASAVAEKLKLTLHDTEQAIVKKNPTKNTEAYELYLKGRFNVGMRGAYIFTAINFFQRAIEADPNFAQAYAGYADASMLLAYYALIPPKQVMGKAKEAADKAITLDPSLCEPYNSLGFYYACFEWNWQLAEKNFLRAIELNPHSSYAHYWYGYRYLACIKGNFEEAEKHSKIAIEIEPLNATAYAIYGSVLYTASKFSEALTACQTGTHLDPNSFICYANEGCVYLALNEPQKALASFERALILSKRHHWMVNGLIISYCALGQKEKARQLMDELKQRAKTEYIAGTFTAIAAAHLGNVDEAFGFLEKAYQDHDPELITLKHQPWPLRGVAGDPRFQDLLKRIGF